MQNIIDRLSFSRKYWILLWVVLLLPIALFALGTYFVGRTAVINVLHNRNQALSESALLNIEKQLDEIASFANIFSAGDLIAEEAEQNAAELEASTWLKNVEISLVQGGKLSYGDTQAETDWLDKLSTEKGAFWTADEKDLIAVWGYAAEPEENYLLVRYPLANLNSGFGETFTDYGYGILAPDDSILTQQESTAGVLTEADLPDILPNAGIINAKAYTLYITRSDQSWGFFLVQPAVITQSILSTLAIILAFCGLVIFALIMGLGLYNNRQVIQPIQAIVTNLKQVDDENNQFPDTIDDANLKNEVKDLTLGFNKFIDLLRLKSIQQRALQENEQRYSLAIKGANDGIWDWDVEKNFCYFSQRWRYMLGYTQESVHNTITEWFTRVHPDDLASLKADINAHLEGQTPHFENEHRLRHADGTYKWFLARGLAIYDDESGKALRFAGSISDINKRKNYEARLLHDAMHDPLTKLPNRAYFTEILENALGRTQRREDFHAAVIYLDLDRFKLINDSLGHKVGDKVLIEITQRLRECLRTMDTVSRFGGDEFAILLEEINGLQDAIHISRRILQELHKTIHVPNQELVINTSIGIVLITRGYQSAEEILRDADTAMYQAKANGRGKFEVFDRDMHAYTINKLHMENEIRKAMNNKEFKVFYQPIVDAENNEIQYVEALLRWQHPQKGLINTESFIPLAEESGLILSLNKWVLHTACAEVRQWYNHGYENMRVSVNVSPTLLTNPDFGNMVRSALSDYELQPDALMLEISENVGVYNSGVAIQNLYELSSIGVKFCLDDYGLVASSLEQLKRLPIFGIKIARSFVQDLPSNSDDAAIAQAIIAMANILGFHVFGEGVETEEQLNFLVEKGCEYLQGFYFAHPIHRSDFINNLIAFGDKIENWVID